MLMNNLDPDVAERPADLVVYGGTGRAARSWEAFHAIVQALRTLADDETLLVQSGKPVGVFRTHAWSPRVLIANSNLVPEWATWEEFRRLEQLGLTMYGQMTAGSWIYIGSQGIVQGTYECFAEIARRRHGGSLAGTITLTSGLGGMGGAQPLAITMNGGAALCVEVDRSRIERRLETRYLDQIADNLDDAAARVTKARDDGVALSVGLEGNAADLVPAVLRGPRAIPLGGPVGRPGRHRGHRPRGARGVPGRRAPRALDWRGPREDCVPGAAGAHLLAGLRAARPARAALQPDGRPRRAARADRHRPRPPGLRLGRLALPRDRGHGRRLRRDRRLALAERAPQHRVRRDLGVDPPRRRGRHRALDPRRPGRGRRRQRDRGAEARARAHERPRHRRDAPRRRRLRERAA